MNHRKKNNSSIVYSTDPDFVFEDEMQEEIETLPPNQQTLRISLDKKQRAGKKVTLISNFIGSEEDLIALSKTLKTKCSVGGSVKDGDILLQGDFREKVAEILSSLGYKTKRIN
ncbi:MAG: translation initiation factor [Bacteroidales bacterium]|nr:translation initiation factor [Bacteroidales bacterium]MDY6403460.1 translation initiation factor [Bacteroidales bacterium]MDY6424309.1 translation initiation factor [Bacteroidales bacterium]